MVVDDGDAASGADLPVCNPFEEFPKAGPQRKVVWCIWEVLKDSREGLSVFDISHAVSAQKLRSFTGNANSQVSTSPPFLFLLLVVQNTCWCSLDLAKSFLFEFVRHMRPFIRLRSRRRTSIKSGMLAL